MSQTPTAPPISPLALDVFERERRRLLSVAYGLLGSLTEAEDVVQDAYLRLVRTDFESIHEPEAWLTTVVTRLALDQLRSARHRRETYPGEWLPEPVFDAPLADQQQITRSRLSLALLHLLEKLKPEERAVFVLREVFEHGYRDIAAMLGKSEAACRQMMTRARARLGPRESQAPDKSAAASSLVERFIGALAAGDEQALLDLLAPDAVLYGDGGGKSPSVLNPVFGAERIVRFFFGLERKYPGRFLREPITINAEPGLLTFSDGSPASVTALVWQDGRITVLRTVSNPDKLRHGLPSTL